MRHTRRHITSPLYIWHMYPDCIRSPHTRGTGGSSSTVVVVQDQREFPLSVLISDTGEEYLAVILAGAQANEHGDEVLLKRRVSSAPARAICYSSAVAMSLLVSAGVATATAICFQVRCKLRSVTEVTVSDSEA